MSKYTFVKYEKTTPKSSKVQFGFVELFRDGEFTDIFLELSTPIFYRDEKWVIENIDNITNLTLYKGRIRGKGESWRSYPYKIYNPISSNDGFVMLYKFKDKSNKTIGCAMLDTSTGRLLKYNYNALYIRDNQYGSGTIYNGSISIDKGELIRPATKDRHGILIISEQKLAKISQKPREFDRLMYDNNVLYTYVNNRQYGNGWMVGFYNKDAQKKYNIIPDELYGIRTVDIQSVLKVSEITIVSKKLMDRVWGLHENVIKSTNMEVRRLSKTNLDKFINKINLVGTHGRKILVIIE